MIGIKKEKDAICDNSEIGIYSNISKKSTQSYPSSVSIFGKQGNQ